MEQNKGQQKTNTFIKQISDGLLKKYNIGYVKCLQIDKDEKVIFQINKQTKIIVYFNKITSEHQNNKTDKLETIEIEGKAYTMIVRDTLGLTIEALRNKYNTSNIKYIGGGAEGTAFVINDKMVVKVYNGSINNSIENLEKQSSNFRIIDGTVKPKEINTIQVDGEVYIIQTSKYAENGELRNIINNSEFDYHCSFPIAFWLTLDLFYTHQTGIVHLDFREDNIVINGKGKPKIIDYNLSKAIGDNSSVFGRASNWGTSPDLTQNAIVSGNKTLIRCLEESVKIRVSDKHDICPLGFIFIKLFFDKKFFKNIKDCEFMIPDKKVSDVLGEYNKQFIKKIDELKNNSELREQQLKLIGPDNVKLQLLDLIKNMINPITELRPSIEEVLKKIVEIYPLVSKNYEKYTINGKEYNFAIKNKEKLFSRITAINDIDFNEEEIEKISNTTEKIVKSLQESNEVSGEFKETLNNYVENNDFSEKDKNILETMSEVEKRLLNRVVKRISLLEQVKNNKEIIEDSEFMKEDTNSKFIV